MKTIISIHFPKAAGSSLGGQFEAHFGKAMAYDYNHDPLGPNADLEDQQIEPGIRIVHGHFRARRYAAVPDTTYVTVLREPLDNLLSIYYFWMDFPPHHNPVHNRFLEEKPTPEAFATYPGMSTLMSEHYFGGFDMDRMHFVAFHDRRAIDIPRLGESLAVPLKAEIHVNPTSDKHFAARREVLDDPARCSRIRDILRADVNFFEREHGKWAK